MSGGQNYIIHKLSHIYPFQVLAFLQDVSDRVDKEDVDSAILLSLERNRHSIVQGNWQEALDERVRDDLRKHRTYNPKAVRDLLRALRNKGSISKRHLLSGKYVTYSQYSHPCLHQSMEGCCMKCVAIMKSTITVENDAF